MSDDLINIEQENECRISELIAKQAHFIIRWGNDDKTLITSAKCAYCGRRFMHNTYGVGYFNERMQRHFDIHYYKMMHGQEI